jgi:hypothetical protein
MAHELSLTYDKLCLMALASSDETKTNTSKSYGKATVSTVLAIGLVPYT